MTNLEWFDTHAHLDSEDFDGLLDDVVSRAEAAGVRSILTIGTTRASSERNTALAQTHDGLYAAVGIQPNHVHEAASGDWDAIVQLARQPRVVGLGETGLDRYWDHARFDIQQDYFDRHLRLAQERDLPVVIHMRDCDADVLEMLRGAAVRGPLRGVMHSFTGAAATAAECLALGLHVSFAGMVTYKKSDELRRIAATVPDDRLLIETDSPYLSPEPFRGKRPNEPARVVHTGACLAEVRGVTIETLAAQTTRNARRLFGVA